MYGLLGVEPNLEKSTTRLETIKDRRDANALGTVQGAWLQEDSTA